MKPPFLLIDDNEIFAHLMIRTFARHQLQLDHAKDGQAALEHSPELSGIILDLNLDGESGLRLLPQLIEHFEGVKIVVLTGFASISTAVSAVKAGAWQYLSKPTDTETLLAAFGSDMVPEVSETQHSLKRNQWEYIHYTLEQHDGNISATARSLNMHRRTLQRMLAKYPVKK